MTFLLDAAYVMGRTRRDSRKSARAILKHSLRPAHAAHGSIRAITAFSAASIVVRAAHQ
jgi:hypothetical protein